MLDLIGTTVITAAIVVNLNAVITMMPLSSAQRLTGVAIAGLWIGLAIALAGREFTPMWPRRCRRSG
jgi:phosphate/sulfate permease